MKQLTTQLHCKCLTGAYYKVVTFRAITLRKTSDLSNLNKSNETHDIEIKFL